MLEGRPLTNLAFIEEKMMDRAIIIRSPVDFRKPLVSGIFDGILETSGLTNLLVKICRGDTIHY